MMKANNHNKKNNRGASFFGSTAPVAIEAAADLEKRRIQTVAQQCADADLKAITDAVNTRMLAARLKKQ